MMENKIQNYISLLILEINSFVDLITWFNNQLIFELVVNIYKTSPDLQNMRVFFYGFPNLWFVCEINFFMKFIRYMINRRVKLRIKS